MLKDAEIIALLAALAAVVGVGAVIYFNRDAIVATLKTKLNPASSENLVYQGVSAAGAAVTGRTDGSFTLGSWLYDITNPNQPKADAPVVVVPAGNGEWLPQSVYEMPGVFLP